MAPMICSSKSTAPPLGQRVAVALDDVGEAVDVAAVVGLDRAGSRRPSRTSPRAAIQVASGSVPAARAGFTSVSSRRAHVGLGQHVEAAAPRRRERRAAARRGWPARAR